MKVGIMSMQRVCNYGSFLQAYGLKKMVESLGHEVVFVDYRVRPPRLRGSKEKIRFLLSKWAKTAFAALERLPWAVHWLPPSWAYAAKAHNRYREQDWKVLGLPPRKRCRTPVDVLLIGSDEVFNCLQKNPAVGFSPDLFGVDARARTVSTYAASFGNTTLDALRDAGVADLVKGWLSRLDAVSVRDKNSLAIVRALTGRSDVVENMDPVLAYDFHDVPPREVPLSGYLVVYAYKGRLAPREIDAIRDYASRKRKKIVAIGGYQPFADLTVQDSPFRILDYFRHADAVVTDTFHGTIFSVVSHARFGVFVREGHGSVYGNSEKLLDLLRRLGLENRLLDLDKGLDGVLDADWDAAAADAVVARERQNSMAYLARVLAPSRETLSGAPG